MLKQASLQSKSSTFIQQRQSYSIIKKIINNVKKESQKADPAFHSDLTKISKIITIPSNAIREFGSKVAKNVSENNKHAINELQEAVKAVQKKTDEIKELVTPSQETMEAFGKTVKVIVDSPVVKPITTTVDAIGKGAQAVSDAVIDEQKALRYGGFFKKEQRQKIIKERLQTFEQRIQPDKVTSHVAIKKSGTFSRITKLLTDNSIVKGLEKIQKSIDSSNNIFIYHARDFVERFSTAFQENEAGATVRKLTERDPNFSVENFTNELIQFILPEVIESYANHDLNHLERWLSEGAHAQCVAKFKASDKPNMFISSKILDMREVDILQYKIIQGEPVLVVQALVQQVTVWKNENNEIVDGKFDEIRHLNYILALSREEEISDPITDGWKVGEIIAMNNRTREIE